MIAFWNLRSNQLYRQTWVTEEVDPFWESHANSPNVLNGEMSVILQKIFKKLRFELLPRASCEAAGFLNRAFPLTSALGVWVGGSGARRSGLTRLRS